MNSLDQALRLSSRSWKTFAGSVAMTAVLFLSIASTTFVVRRPSREDAPLLSYAFVPPPPLPITQQTTPPLSSSLAEAFKFDPTTAGPLPDIPLELLDVTLDPFVDPGVAIELDLQRGFTVQKPEAPDRFMIFERNQVDEIPVWLYGTMVEVPRQLQNADSQALVLYTVSDQGRTSNIHVLDSNDPAFSASVREAIKDWRFRPARKGGKPVSVWVQHFVNYNPGFRSPFSL